MIEIYKHTSTRGLTAIYFLSSILPSIESNEIGQQKLKNLIEQCTGCIEQSPQVISSPFNIMNVTSLFIVLCHVRFEKKMCVILHLKMSYYCSRELCSLKLPIFSLTTASKASITSNIFRSMWNLMRLYPSDNQIN